MKYLTIIFCLALAGCQDAIGFRRGDASDGRVQLDNTDKCIVWISVYSGSLTPPDVGIHARIISPECAK